MGTGRCAAAAVKLNNYVYFIGGGLVTGVKATKNVQALNLSKPKAWIKISDMLVARCYAAATVLNSTYLQ